MINLTTLQLFLTCLIRLNYSSMRLVGSVLITALVLTACRSPYPARPLNSADAPLWQQHEQKLQQLTQYQVQGTFVYLSDKKKIYARFFLQQYHPEHYRLQLVNPLGSTELELVVQKGRAQLTDNQGKSWESHHPQQLLQDFVGISLPLNELRQWLLGLPGSASNIKLNSQQRLMQLHWPQEEKTWTVDYQEYDSRLTPPLPVKLELTQHQQRIKLKMDNWVFK